MMKNEYFYGISGPSFSRPCFGRPRRVKWTWLWFHNPEQISLKVRTSSLGEQNIILLCAEPLSCVRLGVQFRVRTPAKWVSGGWGESNMNLSALCLSLRAHTKSVRYAKPHARPVWRTVNISSVQLMSIFWTILRQFRLSSFSVFSP